MSGSISAAENVRRLSAECAARVERARVSAERFAEGVEQCLLPAIDRLTQAIKTVTDQWLTVTLTDGRTHLMRRRRTLTHWPDHSHLYNGRTP